MKGIGGNIAAIGDSQGGICVQCALKEFVGYLERGIDPMTHPEGSTGGRFEGDVLEHMRTVHPDPIATQRERDDLEARARVAFGKMQDLARARASAARYN